MYTNNQNVIIKLPCKDYVRTAEDERNSKLEKEWKDKRNIDALNSFMRNRTLTSHFSKR